MTTPACCIECIELLDMDCILARAIVRLCTQDADCVRYSYTLWDAALQVQQYMAQQLVPMLRLLPVSVAYHLSAVAVRQTQFSVGH